MTSFSRLTLLAALALPSLLAGCGSDSSGDTDTSDPTKTECTPGDTKAAADGCNTCSCQQNGFFACTEKACGSSCQTNAQCASLPTGPCQVAVCQAGQCQALPTACPAPTCQSNADCAKPGDPCALAQCIEGTCAIGAKPDCPGSSGCKSDLDCPQPGAPCASAVCKQGMCTVTQDPSCGPCDGPMPSCPAPPPGCDYQGGGCVDGAWTCGSLVCESQCQTVADCPAPPPDGCSQVACEKGLCVTSQTPACSDLCKGQDAVGDGLCDAFFGYAWNAQECAGVSGCSCQGTDCDELWPDLATCQKAHSDCPTFGGCKTTDDCSPICTGCADGSQVCAQPACTDGKCVTPTFPPCGGVVPGGKCDQPGSTAPASDGCNTCTCEKSFTWSCTEIACPSQCQLDEDCPQPGAPCLSAVCQKGTCTLVQEPDCGGSCKSTADCAQPMPPECVKCFGINNCSQVVCNPDTSQCQKIAPSCGDSCEPQDIQPVGPCEAEIGVAWTGTSCITLSGCSCQGQDCGQIYPDKVTCEAVHQSCVVPF